MYFITLILGLTGNTLVLVIVVKRKRKRTENDVFIANLAVSDLALLLFFLPIKLYSYLTCEPRVPFAAFCTFVYPMSVLTFSTSIFTMTAMSVHRCRRIVSPFLAPIRRVYICAWLVVIWVFSVVLIIPLSVLTKLNPENGLCKEHFPSMKTKKVYTAVLFAVQCVIPLFIILGAYLLIFRDLNKSNVHRASVNKKGRITTNCSRSENKQVISTIAAIVFLFVLCTFPTQVAWMAADFGDKDAVAAAMIIFRFSDILAVFHSCLNPIVYGTLTRYFRRGFYRYLCCFYKRCNKRPFSQTSSFSRQQPRQNYFFTRATSKKKDQLIKINL